MAQNGRDGVRIEGAVAASLTNVATRGNGGHGINVVSEKSQPEAPKSEKRRRYFSGWRPEQ